MALIWQKSKERELRSKLALIMHADGRASYNEIKIGFAPLRRLFLLFSCFCFFSSATSPQQYCARISSALLRTCCD